jgi:hypothetical protein
VSDRIHRLNCGDWSGGMAGELKRLGVGAIVLHRGLYQQNRAVENTAWFASRALIAHGWTVQRTAGPVWLFERRGLGLLPALPEPPRTEPVFCQGWYGDTGAGRYMSERHAPFWIYGSGKPRLEFATSALRPRVSVYGGRTRGWHLVTVDLPRLHNVPGQKRRVGARLLRVTLASR